ncbi:MULTISPECIES: helix-turn-helix domain-containing protein [Streptomyces]|uniref:DNA-binding protein n=1 Tax=Streptomyces griseus subsp. griseus (strain JCM 4626 / CBS 651.72 / NBRC 13350 / KCC S-0626 / ISP 5235) TaxID=455632 RepID=B1W4X9_STRGG|nr:MULTISPECIES: helix-turn-helix transcriptional regulator [Streptomyces]MYR13297.1 helix-turn-helix domain-containing protein [Streptomyces sp. SID724]MYR50561.1 helix-turn-helix domain-containing protein [Streptomyces sp. SID4928]EGE42516.1 helix-turn-helix domain protein [Streptomyces sp. ACT-1]MBW3705414.1 XRE family transcriptional regulator [Streptomyces griseus]SCD62686.1 Helix-turn-helix domain-containing protein [Streptomyces sp. OspMP-M43]
MVNRKELDPERSASAAFGALLRSLRDERGWTQDELGDRIRCSGAHISAVETGRRSPTDAFAASADRALGTGDRLQRQSRAARYTALLEGFPEYVKHEERASEIRLYEVGVIPGILQTPEYASALTARAVERGAITPEQGEERISLVKERQAALIRTPPPLVFVVLDESCLRRPVGETATMDGQWKRLVDFAALPNTVLQVAPFDMGDRRPLSLPLYVLTMQNRSLISYAESAQRGQLERDSASVVPLLTAYHQLQAEALSQAASVVMIEQLRRGTP